MARRGRPTDYSAGACSQVVRLMSEGLSLAASAGAMGICRATIHRWIAAHPEFRDSVSRAKAMRVFKLETELLASKNAAVINARRFALVNAAPEEWRKKQSVDLDIPNDSSIRTLARQLMGTAIRPQHPNGQDTGKLVMTLEELRSVTVTNPVTTNDD
jgi:hypothetical protein